MYKEICKIYMKKLIQLPTDETFRSYDTYRKGVFVGNSL